MFNHGSVQLRKSPRTVCNVSDLSGFRRDSPDPSPLCYRPRNPALLSWPGAHLAAAAVVKARSVCTASVSFPLWNSQR